MRLDKLLASSTQLSRSQVKSAIKKSSVKVNSITVTNPALKVSEDDRVVFNNQSIEFPRDLYYVLYKPPGYICSTQDEEYPSALNILSDCTSPNLHFAGRLDQDTTGLVLITSDGNWSHKVTSPRKKCHKTYKVWLKHSINQIQIQQLEQGILLNGESKPTLPAEVEKIDEKILKLTICEGRYHQVKRMIAAVNNRVVRLHRESVGQVNLEGLSEGEWRVLTQKEIQYF